MERQEIVENKYLPPSQDSDANTSDNHDSKQEPENATIEENVVDFTGPDDPVNPLNWTRAHKWTIVALVSLMSLIVNLATIICAPAAPQILHDFNTENALDSTLIVSIWELGEIFGPLLIAPLSELYGRHIVYQTANIFFVIFSIGGALSTSIGMLITFRCLTGLSVACFTLNPGIVGDMFVPEERGSAMAFMGFSPMLGVISGPIIGGYLTEAAGWRWAFWIVTILTGVTQVGFLLFFRETYKVAILEKKAKSLRKSTGNQFLKSKFDSGLSPTDQFKQAMIRPARLLIFSPILLFITLHISILYGYLYLVMTTITPVFQAKYQFGQGSVGLVYIGLAIGMFGGALFCRFTLDKLIKRTSSKSQDGEKQPEQRLPPMIIGGLVAPLALFLYGWTTNYQVHWIVPIIATAILGFSLMVTMIPATTYLVDIFKTQAASAIAANIVFKNLAGAVVPLIGPPLYSSLGLGWGNSVLGFIALAFLPAPLLLWRFGKEIRSRQGFTIV